VIGDKIKKLRKDKLLTLKDLGDLLDMSPSFLSDIENNRTQPSLVRLKEIAKELNVSVCQLLEEHCEIHDQVAQYRPDFDINEGLKGKEFEDLRKELDQVKNWSQEDRQELISYLKVKNITQSSNL
jgi:transcriptional regulator with XRE-family HTH domain